MGRRVHIIHCSDLIRAELERISRNQTAEIKLVHQANMILGCLDRKRIIDIAADNGEQKDVIIKWRNRFKAQGIAGLMDASRSGKPLTYGDEWKAMVLKTGRKTT